MIEKLLPFVWIYLIALFFLATYRGFAYDIAKEKEDPSYKGWHSLSFKNGWILFALPLLIFSKSKDKAVLDSARKYNKVIWNMYITILLLIIIYCIKD
jgi:hypothetical protein